MSKALPIGGALFLHTLRSPGFVGVIACAALLILSLAGITGFGLGREFIMIREASFGTLFLAAFLASILSCLLASEPKTLAWLDDSTTRGASRSAQAHGFILSSVLSGLWTGSALFPFLVSSISLFHGFVMTSLICLLLGIAGVVFSILASRSNRPVPFTLALSASASVICLGLFASVPDFGDTTYLAFITVASLVLSCSFSGFLMCILHGNAGAAVSLLVFILCNMRDSLPGSRFTVFSLLPDLSALNPSRLASSQTALDCSACLQAFAYVAVSAAALLWLAHAAAAVRETQS
jgi:hypothetical protein